MTPTKATDFNINDRFRILSKGYDPRETYTVRKVEDDYIVSEGDKRFQGTDCITTDVALAVLEIELVNEHTEPERKVEQIIDRVKEFHRKGVSKEKAAATLVAQYTHASLIAAARHLFRRYRGDHSTGSSDAAKIVVATVYNAHSDEVRDAILQGLAKLEANPGVSFSFDELVHPEIG